MDTALLKCKVFLKKILFHRRKCLARNIEFVGSVEKNFQRIEYVKENNG